jgi:hypothetical protein
MEFITDFEKNTNEYSTKIKDSIYLEKAKEETVKGVKDICEVIIGANEIEYQTIGASEKPKFVQDKKLDIASNVIKNANHTKKFSQSLIQNGFQSINHFSSVLYLNEFYKVNCIIYNNDAGKYYQTTVKNYEPLYCVYRNNSWFQVNDMIDSEKLKFAEIKELSSVLTLDYASLLIYQPFLESLSKYKVKQLEEIAEKDGISLVNGAGKKKIKKELYDDINLKHYIQDI